MVLLRCFFFFVNIIIFFGAVALGIIKFIWTTTIRQNLFDCIVYATVEYKTLAGSVLYANEHFLFCFIFTPGFVVTFSLPNRELLF